MCYVCKLYTVHCTCIRFIFCILCSMWLYVFFEYTWVLISCSYLHIIYHIHYTCVMWGISSKKFVPLYSVLSQCIMVNGGARKQHIELSKLICSSKYPNGKHIYVYIRPFISFKGKKMRGAKGEETTFIHLSSAVVPMYKFSLHLQILKYVNN